MEPEISSGSRRKEVATERERGLLGVSARTVFKKSRNAVGQGKDQYATWTELRSQERVDCSGLDFSLPCG